MTTRMFNVRVERDLEDAIEKAAADAGLRKSVWAREVLAVVALGGVPLSSLSQLVTGLDRPAGTPGPHPARFIALQSSQRLRYARSGACIHPPQALRVLPFTDVCGLCGTVVRQK